MEFCFGIKGKDFVVLAADSHLAFSIIRLTDDERKVTDIGSADAPKAIVAVGPQGDRTRLVNELKAELELYRLQNGVSLSTPAAAALCRTTLATALRKAPVQVDLLLGGVDKVAAGGGGAEMDEAASGVKASLFWMDYLAARADVPFCAHGHAANFVLGFLDRHWKPEMNEEQVLDLARRCADEVARRLIISFRHFKASVVDKNGVRDVHVSVQIPQ